MRGPRLLFQGVVAAVAAVVCVGARVEAMAKTSMNNRICLGFRFRQIQINQKQGRNENEGDEIKTTISSLFSPPPASPAAAIYNHDEGREKKKQPPSRYCHMGAKSLSS